MVRTVVPPRGSRNRMGGVWATRAAPPTVRDRASGTEDPCRALRASTRLDRDSPEREPALELALDRQLGPDLGLQAQLALGVALVVAGARNERVEGAALVVVDPVERPASDVLEGENGAQ